MIAFIKQEIVHRFGILETITADRGSVFIFEAMHTVTNELGIKLIHSSPNYPKANGQAEASNKVVINVLKRMIADKPRDWHKFCLNLCGPFGPQSILRPELSHSP